MGNVILDIGVGIVTLALMFSVGLSLKPDSLLSACHPLSRMAGHLAVTSVIPPLAGLATVLLLSPPPTVATAILLISACPVGDISNVYALIARADTGLSLAINVTSVLAAPLTMIPVLAVFHVLGYGEGLPAVPAGPLLLRLFLLLILPVSIGALVRDSPTVGGPTPAENPSAHQSRNRRAASICRLLARFSLCRAPGGRHRLPRIHRTLHGCRCDQPSRRFSPRQPGSDFRFVERPGPECCRRCDGRHRPARSCGTRDGLRDLFRARSHPSLRTRPLFRRAGFEKSLFQIFLHLKQVLVVFRNLLSKRYHFL